MQATTERTLPLVRATEENIAPFGMMLGGEKVINAGAPIPFYTESVIEGGNIDFRYSGRAVIRCARIFPSRSRDDVVWLERHLDMTQIFVPLGDEPFVMVLAPPNHADGGNLPELERVTAFLFPPGHALLLHIGTWHDFPIAPNGPLTVVTMNSDEVVQALQSMAVPGEMDFNDVYKVNIPQRTGQRLRIDLTRAAT